MRDELYRAGITPQMMRELERRLASLTPEERRDLERQAQSHAPFQEELKTELHPDFLEMVKNDLQNSNDPEPVVIKPLPFVNEYSPNYCNVNARKYILKNSNEGEIAKGFKIYQAFKKGELVGYKAIVHFVVVVNQQYIDPTPDDPYLFVQSSRLPNKNEDKYHRRGVRLSGVVYGNDEYKDWVNSLDELQKFNLVTVRSPENLKMLVTHDEGDEIRLRGLTSRPELNGEKGVLGEYDPTNDRWEVFIIGKNGLKVKKSNISVRKGDEIQLTGLTNKPELNGKRGVLGKYDYTNDRWEVFPIEERGLKVKTDNTSVIKNPRLLSM